MKSHARAVVIGGGILGCGLLFRLTRFGWTDVVLVEKGELTSGTTWHSAGNLILLEESVASTKVNRLSWSLYQTLAADTGHPIGHRRTGGLRLAKSRKKLERFRRNEAKARYFDIDYRVIDTDTVMDLFPLLNPEGVVGASWMPDEGHVDPSQVTQACAQAARAGGAEIYRHTRVTGLHRTRSGAWQVDTDKGSITTEVVVNAAGMWAPEIGRMVGVSLPIVPTERQYLVTEPVPALQALDHELPIVRDYEVPFYVRQEGKALLYGIHEPTTPFCFQDGIPPDFGQQLLPPDLERGAHHIEQGIHRIPVLGEVGIKTVICGPTSRTTDFNGLIGPVCGLRNYFVVAGFSAGVLQGAAVGQLAAEWIVEGEPSLDVRAFDVNRFGPYATPRYIRAGLGEFHVYGTLDPSVERQAGRPAKASPLYHALKARGAVYGARFGWERPLWFAGTDAAPTASREAGPSERSHQVAEECRAVRERVGLADMTAAAKYEVSGPGARRFLDRLCARPVADRDGHVIVAPLLTPKGGIQCLMTVARLAPDRFYLVGEAEAELHHLEWLLRHGPERGDAVHVDNLTGRNGALLLAGPRSEEVLAKLTDAELRRDAFPPMTVGEMTVAFAPVVALRATSVGEPGWQLHVPVEYLSGLYDALMEAGRESGIADVGLNALESLALEAGEPRWGVDVTLETSTVAAGLDDHGPSPRRAFIGRAAAKRRSNPKSALRRTFLVVDPGDGDSRSGDAVLDGTSVVGLVATGGYGHTIGKGIAVAYLPPKLARPGCKLAIEVQGAPRTAIVVATPLSGPGDIAVAT